MKGIIISIFLFMPTSSNTRGVGFYVRKSHNGWGKISLGKTTSLVKKSPPCIQIKRKKSAFKPDYNYRDKDKHQRIVQVAAQTCINKAPRPSEQLTAGQLKNVHSLKYKIPTGHWEPLPTGSIRNSAAHFHSRNNLHKRTLSKNVIYLSER